MSKWFIYCGTNYYPSSEVVEADTAEGAVLASEYDEYDRPLVVFPVEARALLLTAYDDDDAEPEVQQWAAGDGVRASQMLMGPEGDER